MNNCGCIDPETCNHYINRAIFYQYYTNCTQLAESNLLPHHILLHNASIWFTQRFNTGYVEAFTPLAKFFNLFHLDEEAFLTSLVTFHRYYSASKTVLQFPSNYDLFYTVLVCVLLTVKVCPSPLRSLL